MSQSAMRRRPSRRTAIVIAGLIAVLVAGSTWIWLARSDQVLSGVEVLPGSLQCDGKTIHAEVIDDPFEQEPPRPIFKIDLDPKNECWLTVAVSNPGPRPVKLETLTFPGMMPGESGSSLLETPVDDNESKPHEIDGNGDAVFDVDEIIEAGDWTELTYRIGYRVDGGSCPGGMAGRSDFPIARVRSDGRSVAVVGSVNIVHPTVETIGNRGNCGD